MSEINQSKRDDDEERTRDRGFAEIPRRNFLALSGIGLASLFASGEAVAGPFERDEFDELVPADKKFTQEWLASLTARGVPETFTGNDLEYIGMPVGGLCTGTLYLAGDGRLWLWDIFNFESLGIDPEPVVYEGRSLGPIDGSAYVRPRHSKSVVEQGFAVRIRTQGDPSGKTRTLDRDGFRNVQFTGRYPIGTVTYQDDSVPITVELNAYSPFIPLNLDDSSLPATVMSFTIKNESRDDLEVDLAGKLENAVGRYHREYAAIRRNRIDDDRGFTFLECSAEADARAVRDARPDLVFEDWTRDRYEGWRVEGDAFGSGPIHKKKMPSYQGDVGGPGDRVVNSHATAPGNDVGSKDDHTGKLTSKPFTIERKFIHLWIGGGNNPGSTCVNLVVAGKVVQTVTGRNDNRMRLATLDARPWIGVEARIEIVDARKGGWGNVGVGRITFSDRPQSAERFDELHDFGVMGLALLGKPAPIRSAQIDKDMFTNKQSDSAEASIEAKLTGAIGGTVAIKPGESAQMNFLIVWRFPNQSVLGRLKGQYYASRFDSARGIARYVVEGFERLSSLTKRWRDVWYDSTLPYWFLNRTFSNTSVLATSTSRRFADGRFWGWEGIGCCPGTCTHVWHYAQAPGRVFPEIERNLRERVDLGSALDPKTGVVRYRGEFGDLFAVDGQCGVILRAYRDHQTSADDAYLKRLWPKIKRALECVIDRDKEGSGILRGPMHNTLDADWYGVVPWLVGLYHAALRAGEEMALEVGDAEFARLCRSRFDSGVRELDKLCWREKFGYYVHVGDPAHMNEVGSYDGCEIDQVFGQSWAWQTGLGRVMDESHVRRALDSLWRYGVTPDVGRYRKANPAGRWYAMPGEGGLLMVTFPFGRPPQVSGPGAWSAMYFNECMSGFEWQVCSHMIWEGMTVEGLAVARLIHDRYHPRLRNPYNEVECSDHYARSMASFGAFLAACGFEHHGPKGKFGFAPRIGAGDFRAPFVAAEGWGTYEQKIEADRLSARLAPKHGSARVKTFAVEVPATIKVASVEATLGGAKAEAKFDQTGRRVVVTFDPAIRASEDRALEFILKGQG